MIGQPAAVNEESRGVRENPHTWGQSAECVVVGGSKGETPKGWVFPTCQGWTREVNTRMLNSQRGRKGKEEKGWKGACRGALTLVLFLNLEASAARPQEGRTE